MRVLVADDDAVHRHLVSSTLSSWGYLPVPAVDGLEALRILQGENAPELAILDWTMPGLDGDRVCQQVREHTRERYLYLLILTAKCDRADLLCGLEAGADDYLCKPFDPPELKARLNTGRRILQLQNELIAAREAMRRQATRDGLTGVWNHAAILEIVQRELGRGTRQHQPVGIVLADLDHFKRINDTHGHLAGDAVLREVCVRIEHALRPYDLIGRYGGEEFLIVLPGCDAESTFKVCERMRLRISEQPIGHDGRGIPVSLSAGAAVSFPSCAGEVVSLIRSADAALYRAKTNGRNRVELAGS